VRPGERAGRGGFQSRCRFVKSVLMHMEVFMAGDRRKAKTFTDRRTGVSERRNNYSKDREWFDNAMRAAFPGWAGWDSATVSGSMVEVADGIRYAIRHRYDHVHVPAAVVDPIVPGGVVNDATQSEEIPF
jgi:hypothetical protein